jgi:hypothetical protein
MPNEPNAEKRPFRLQEKILSAIASAFFQVKMPFALPNGGSRGWFLIL